MTQEKLCPFCDRELAGGDSPRADDFESVNPTRMRVDCPDCGERWMYSDAYHLLRMPASSCYRWRYEIAKSLPPGVGTADNPIQVRHFVDIIRRAETR